MGGSSLWLLRCGGWSARAEHGDRPVVQVAGSGEGTGEGEGGCGDGAPSGRGAAGDDKFDVLEVPVTQPGPQPGLEAEMVGLAVSVKVG